MGKVASSFSFEGGFSTQHEPLIDGVSTMFGNDKGEVEPRPCNMESAAQRAP